MEEEPVLATTSKAEQTKRSKGGARPPSRRPTPEQQAQQRADREALSQERAAKRALDKRSIQQRYDSATMLDYNEAAEVLDLQPQTIRDKVRERNLHISESPDGEPKSGDIIAPVFPFSRPRFPEGELRRWAVKNGFLSDKDALTPTRPTPPGRPRGSRNKPKE